MPLCSESQASHKSCVLRRLHRLADWKLPSPGRAASHRPACAGMPLCTHRAHTWACELTQLPEMWPWPLLLSFPLPSSSVLSSCRTICRILESVKVSEPKQCYLRKYFENKLGHPLAEVALVFSKEFHNSNHMGSLGCGGRVGRVPGCPLEKALLLQGEGQTGLERPETGG